MDGEVVPGGGIEPPTLRFSVALRLRLTIYFYYEFIRLKIFQQGLSKADEHF